jgi:peroxiredoxin Q/BCP
MQTTLRFLGTVLIVLAGVSLTGCASYPTPPVVGAPAPDFSLMNQDGKLVSLKDYRGQWVVVYFYPKDFGDFSTTFARSFRRDSPKFTELHTVVVGLSSDGFRVHKNFADQEQLPFALLSDEGLGVTEKYGAFHRAHGFMKSVAYRTFLIDPAGKVACVFYNFDTNDLSGRVLSTVNALQHP